MKKLTNLIAPFFQMESPDRYREFAAECYRLASDAKTEADWKTLLEIARAWKTVAEEVETKTATSANAACHNDAA